MLDDAARGQISDEAKQQLAKAFAVIDSWRERIHAEPTAPAAGSSLAKDDEATSPHQVSHAVVGALLSAVDHFDAFRALLQDAGILHARAPYTLLRAALENGATAVWLLAPSSRNERVLRRLRLQWTDSRDSEKAALLFDTQPNLSKAEWAETLEELARARGLTPQQVQDVTKARATFTEIVRTAGLEGQDLSGRDSLFLWMIASGIAHARMWAILSPMLNRVETPGFTDDLVHLNLSASDTAVVLLCGATLLMVYEAWRLLDERSKNHLE